MIKITTQTGQIIPQSEVTKMELDRQIAEALAYLRETDWYYARKMETGEDIPSEIVNLRIEKRNFLKNLKAVTL